jgi:predicted DNA-binding protein (MmcQ/YjbR family)
MDIETFREYCLAKKGVTEGFPFDSDTLVFKVMNKMFALTSLSAIPFSVNLKMDTELVEQYREKFADVQPGWHMNKKHWNTVCFDAGSISNRDLLWMIDHSYNEVVKGLPKKVKAELNEL